MAYRLDNLDWNLIRSFLAVAETGSLTAAAEKTSQSQPTMGRHIKAAEASLGVELFTRVYDGLQLTESGRLLLEPAREMEKASARFASLATGQDERLSGTVRITASNIVSHYLLPSILADIAKEEPDIELELVPSDTTENLIYREADIAIRMYRPTQLDVITRKIAEQPFALYGSNNLFSRFGQPDNFQDLAALPFVGFDRSDMIIRTMRDIGFTVDRHFFDIRCDNQAVYWELVRAGCGLGAMQVAIGDSDPAVQRTDFQPDLPSIPIWLATNDSLFRTARIKHVWDSLAFHLKQKLG